MSFELACFQNNLVVDYSPYELNNKGLLNGIKPTSHTHTPIIKLREIHGYNYPYITITREEVSRFISGWKYILKLIRDVNKPLYDTLKMLNNEEFIYHFGNHFERLDITREKVVPFLNEFGLNNSKIPKQIIEIFITIFKPTVDWTNNDSTLIKFSFENEIPKFENWISNMCDIDFKLPHINDTGNVELNLIKDELFIDFYQTKLNPTLKHKSNFSLI
jgi:hypothetical protein